jgi:hypothetical protein
MSCSASEPESASKRKVGSGQGPRLLEASICHEAMVTSSGRTPRGGRGQRVSIREHPEPGRPTPAAARNKTEGKIEREEITAKIAGWESERPIVALKRSNFRGAKGPWHE